MANRKRNRQQNTRTSSAPALAKAESPSLQVPSKGLLFDYQPQAQKWNTNAGEFETLFRAAQTNAWANRAIAVIAASVVANGWKPTPLDPKAQPNSPAEAVLMRFLSQPNDDDSFNDVIARIVWDLYCCGNSYWEVPRVNQAQAKKHFYNTTAGTTLAKDSDLAVIIEDAFDASIQQFDGLPLGLFYLDPRSMSIQTDEHGRVQTYTQRRRSDGKTVIFQRSEVIHFRLKGAEPGIYGKSPLLPLELDLAIDLYRQTYIKSLLENSSMLGLFFSFEGANPETIARFQEWLNVHTHGAVNAGKNVVMDGKLNINGVPEPPIGKGSTELGNSLKEKIVTCLGVPVAKIGTMDAGSLGGQNQEGSNKSFIENTVKPLARLIERQFNLQLIPDFKVVGVDGYGIAILTEDIDILQTRAETVTRLVDAGVMTRNEGRVELKQTPYEGVGDVPLILAPGGVVRLEDAETAPLQPATSPQQPQQPDQPEASGKIPKASLPEGKDAGELGPAARDAKITKTLTALANELLKVISDEAN